MMCTRIQTCFSAPHAAPADPQAMHAQNQFYPQGQFYHPHQGYAPMQVLAPAPRGSRVGGRDLDGRESTAVFLAWQSAENGSAAACYWQKRPARERASVDAAFLGFPPSTCIVDGVPTGTHKSTKTGQSI